jgi:DNA-binding response OmpR family regulator
MLTYSVRPRANAQNGVRGGSYTGLQSGAVRMDKIGILIIDDDEASQSALRQVLDSEAWSVSIAPLATVAFQELATGDWTLVIANVLTTGLSGPLYTTLRELAQASPESGKSRLRVLFLIPENAGQEAKTVLESEQLPYALKPFHFHDLLERVSDLLMETGAIADPIRRVRAEAGAGARQARSNAQNQASSRNTGMFASRDDYTMTEEELAEYERQQSEEESRKKKKKRSVFD